MNTFSVYLYFYLSSKPLRLHFSVCISIMYLKSDFRVCLDKDISDFLPFLYVLYGMLSIMHI